MNNPIIHLIPKEKFTYGFIRFTNDAFPNKNIWFFVYGQEDALGYKKSNEKNVLVFDKITDALKDIRGKTLLDESALIIFNSVFPAARICCEFWRYRKKAYLMFWGGDIYPRTKSINVFKSPEEWINKICLRIAIKYFKGILTLIPKDLRVIERISAQHGEWHPACLFGLTHDAAENQKKDALTVLASPKPKSPVRILLGNSATRENRHLQALDFLGNFSEQDLVIYAPLSYGDEEYRNEVIKKGKELFSEKFVPLLEYVAFDQYRAFLKTISIGIFNNNRQQGMGNIEVLMRYGAKIYLAVDNPLREEFINQGRITYNANLIEKMKYDDFIKCDRNDLTVNFGFVDPLTKYYKSVSMWQRIYKYLHE